MNKCYLFFCMKILLVLLACLFSNEPFAQVIKNYFLQKDSTIKQVELMKGRYDPKIIAVIRIWEKDWWEGLSIIKYENNKISWEAKFDSIPAEQSIRSVRQLKLKGLENLFYEVYGQTHM